MSQEMFSLVSGLLSQLLEIVRLMLAALGIAFLKKLLKLWVGDERLFEIVRIKYIFDAAHVVLFAKLIWTLVSK